MDLDVRNEGIFGTSGQVGPATFIVQNRNPWWRLNRVLRCSTCGIQTHKQNLFSCFVGSTEWEPLTVEGRVTLGRCLACNPNNTFPSSTSALLALLLATEPLRNEGDDYSEGNVSFLVNSESQGREETPLSFLPCQMGAPLASFPEQQSLMAYTGEKEIEEAFTCCICLREEFDVTPQRSVAGINCCKHRFCFECISEWAMFQTLCPLCKARFTRIIQPLESDNKSDGSASPSLVLKTSSACTHETLDDDVVRNNDDNWGWFRED